MLIEDHPSVRQSLIAMINGEADLEVSATPKSIDDALTMIRSSSPEIVVLDLSVGSVSGLDLIKQLRTERPALPIVALSMHDETLYAERVLRAGARGYLMKKEALDRLLLAIRRVLEGTIYVSDMIAARLVGKFVNATERVDQGVSSLSVRELEVFRMIADGIGPTEIARRLSVSIKTVETHREHIKEKLGVRNAIELTRFALQWSTTSRSA